MGLIYTPSDLVRSDEVLTDPSDGSIFAAAITHAVCDMWSQTPGGMLFLNA